MRRNINKIIAAAIGISVMSGNIMPVFASDIVKSTSNTNVQTQTNVLTLDDAIKAAISISDTLALDEQKIAYQDKFNDINKKQDDFNDVDDDKEDYDDDTADTKLSQEKQKRDFDEDLLTQKVTDQYNNIVTSQLKIDIVAKNLAIEKKNLENAKLKQSLGIQTSIDVKSLELKIQKDEDTQNTSLNKLKDAEYTFKVLTGKDATQYILEKDIKFELLKIEGSVDDYLDDGIDSYLKYSEQLLQISKDYYDKDYEKDNDITTDDLEQAKKDAETATKPVEPSSDTYDPANPNAYQNYEKQRDAYISTQNKYTGLLAERLTYLSTKLSNYSNEVAISEEKKQFKDQLRGYYTNLQTYEDNINYCKKEIALDNEKLSNTKLKYDLGMITETDYNTQVVSTLQAEIDLRNAIISYDQNKEYIQKPWIELYSSSISQSK